MKVKSILVSMFALAALASCNNDDEIVNNIPSEKSTGAYLSLAINMPQSTPGTRAAGPNDGGPGNAPGESYEQTVKTALVVGLLEDNSVEVYELKTSGVPNELGTPGVSGSAAVAGDAFQVSPKLKKIFVVLNPSATAKKQITTANGAMSSVQVFKAIKEEVTAISTTDGFMMTSEGSIDNGAWTEVTPTIATSDAASDIVAAKDAAKNAAEVVKVDRTVSKITLAVTAPTVENGTASVDKFLMNTTNKSYFPYADLVDYTVTAPAVAAKYRKDPNWTKLVLAADGTGTAADAFNWLHNEEAYTWLAPGASTYCHENTMEAAAQDYNNTTKMVIKAQFAPTGVTLGESWFRVGGVIMTFDELNVSYKDASAIDKKKYEAFLDKLLNVVDKDGNIITARTKGWKGEGKATEVTLADLDAVSDGGYKAATVKNQTIDGNDTNMYLIEYYQESVCYYDVNIKHDNRVDAKLLGRWGMVRNNWYTLTVNKISKPGKPYIPDPTDPDITDPTNPDPEKPTPDDQDAAFISVSIAVNNWTTWSQGVDL